MIHGHYNLHSDSITLLRSSCLIETNSTEFSFFNLTLDRVYKLPNGTVRFLVLIYTQTDIFTTEPIIISHICNETYQQTARLEYGEKHPQIVPLFEIVNRKLPTSCLSGIQISSSDIYVEHTKQDCEINLTVD